jgi:hypothetical protein
MIVMLTARIEAGPAAGTDRSTLQVVSDGEFFTAGSTQNGVLAKLGASPHLRRMIGLLFMTLVAGVVRLAALEFDGDNIERAAIMGTAAPTVDLHPVHGDTMNDSLHTVTVGVRGMWVTDCAG